MKLNTEFYKLPLRFDADRLRAEALQFSEAEWRAHPQGNEGNTAIPLITVRGEINDELRGAMRPTRFLDRCPYMQQILHSLGTVIGRSRLMRIQGGGAAKAHVDSSYYWKRHVRVHVPAQTHPDVRFLCGNKSVHMAAGECWIFDTWKMHDVLNPADYPRIHLVADTIGSRHFWEELVGKAERPVADEASPLPSAEPYALVYQPEKRVTLPLETTNFPVVMTPWEQRSLASDLLGEANPAQIADARGLTDATRQLHLTWDGLWAEFGDSPRGLSAYEAALDAYLKVVTGWRHCIELPNGLDLAEALIQAIIHPALNPELGGARPIEGDEPPAKVPQPALDPLDSPVFIVAAPRSGSSMLFELLARSPGFITTGGENHQLFEGIEGLHPAANGFESNRLSADDATPVVIDGLRTALRDAFQNGAPRTPLTLLEKTPKNALRIPFLRAVFPRARFIYLYRDPEQNISSILEAWRSGRFVTYPNLPGWDGDPWSLALVPGWRSFKGKPLASLATHQWKRINEEIISSLAVIPREDWTFVTYTEVVADPQEAATRLCQFANVEWAERITEPLPPARHTLTPPAPDKWLKHRDELLPYLPHTQIVVESVRQLLAGDAIPSRDWGAPPSPLEEPRSTHSTNFPEILAELGISLVVTTYQAGRLIFLREDEGHLNTHFRAFDSPMGVAYDGCNLAVGTRRSLWHFANQTDVAAKLPPHGRHDAAFLPRGIHFTGDIRIHEMEFTEDGLIGVNTRFSCLCSFDATHSFVPVWRPPFITALAPEDRCHLNGLAAVDGKAQYVTCLGLTDTTGGWREKKESGGCIIDLPSGEVVAPQLSMPHSPRFYGGHLWVLESGEGRLSRIDLQSGKSIPVVELPGFTRGLDFHGPFAFVGLSKVRESAVFGGLPLTTRVPEPDRLCGVWVIDLRSGAIISFLNFEGVVREIFAIRVLPGIRYPELVEDNEPVLQSSFVLPHEVLSEVPGTLRGQVS